ncbi:putative DNA polymerase sigma subunit [Blattamonas nauphoetae]|uniref:DNA polymerase sigma subunit n=1 Tax=Blattamonas nauphoetae TaxID=2049346 RepID=A0ABQ9Y0G9_9EUKA|nr:putative DNA polymerase sigma subunit [Blattamonas nauphoetae]
MNHQIKPPPPSIPPTFEPHADKQFHAHSGTVSPSTVIVDKQFTPHKIRTLPPEIEMKIASIPTPDLKRTKDRTFSTSDFFPYTIQSPLSNLFLINSKFFPHFIRAREKFEVPYPKSSDQDDMELVHLESQMVRVPWLKTLNGLYDYIDPYFKPKIRPETDLWKPMSSSVGWMMTDEEITYRKYVYNSLLKQRKALPIKDESRRLPPPDELLQRIPQHFEYNEQHMLRLKEIASQHTERIQLLSTEIRNYGHFMSLTVAEYLARFNLIERLLESVNFLDPSLLLYVYGSFSSYTSLPQSDVDLTLITLDQYKYIRRVQRAIRSLFEIWYGTPPDSTDKARQGGYLSSSVEYQTSDPIRKLIQGITLMENKTARICRICYSPIFAETCRCNPKVAIAIEMAAQGPNGAWMEERNEKKEPRFCSDSGEINMKELLSIQLAPSLQHLLDFSAPLLPPRRVLQYPLTMIKPTIADFIAVKNRSKQIRKYSEKFTYYTRDEKDEQIAQREARDRYMRSLAEYEQKMKENPDPSKPIPPPEQRRANRIQRSYIPSPSFVSELRTRQFDLPPIPHIPDTDFLDRFAQHLEKFNIVSKPELIKTARIPIIKITDKVTGVHCDLGYGTMTGIINTDFLRCLLIIYPEATDLIMILKAFLAKHNLNEPYKGGLGGYALSLLVVSHLQQYSRNFGANYKETPSGQLLLHFFVLYGEMDELPAPPNDEEKFSCEKFGISVRGHGRYLKIPELREQKPELFPLHTNLPIFIEDPLNPSNNTSRSCFNYSLVRDHFRDAYRQLMLPLPPPITPHCFQTTRRHVAESFPAEIRKYTQASMKRREEERRKKEEIEKQKAEQKRREMEEEKKEERNEGNTNDPDIPVSVTPTNAHDPSNPDTPMKPNAVSPTLSLQSELGGDGISIPTHTTIPQFIPSEKGGITRPSVIEDEEKTRHSLFIPSLLGRVVDYSSPLVEYRSNMNRFLENPRFFCDPVLTLKSDTTGFKLQHPMKAALPEALFEKIEQIQNREHPSTSTTTLSTFPAPPENTEAGDKAVPIPDGQMTISQQNQTRQFVSDGRGQEMTKERNDRITVQFSNQASPHQPTQIILSSQTTQQTRQSPAQPTQLTLSNKTIPDRPTSTGNMGRQHHAGDASGFIPSPSQSPSLHFNRQFVADSLYSAQPPLPQSLVTPKTTFADGQPFHDPPGLITSPIPTTSFETSPHYSFHPQHQDSDYLPHRRGQQRVGNDDIRLLQNVLQSSEQAVGGQGGMEGQDGGNEKGGYGSRQDVHMNHQQPLLSTPPATHPKVLGTQQPPTYIQAQNDDASFMSDPSFSALQDQPRNELRMGGEGRRMMGRGRSKGPYGQQGSQQGQSNFQYSSKPHRPNRKNEYH